MTTSDFAKETEPGNIQTEIWAKLHFAAVKAMTADIGFSTCVTCGQRQNRIPRIARDFS